MMLKGVRHEAWDFEVCSSSDVPVTSSACLPASQINPEWVKTAARPFDPPLTEYGEEQVQPVARLACFLYSYTACVSDLLGCLVTRPLNAGAVCRGKTEAV